MAEIAAHEKTFFPIFGLMCTDVLIGASGVGDDCDIIIMIVNQYMQIGDDLRLLTYPVP